MKPHDIILYYVLMGPTAGADVWGRRLGPTAGANGWGRRLGPTAGADGKSKKHTTDGL